MSNSTSSSPASAASFTTLWGDQAPVPTRRNRLFAAATPAAPPVPAPIDLSDTPSVPSHAPAAQTLTLLTEYFEWQIDQRGPDRRFRGGARHAALELMRCHPGAVIKMPPMKVVERMAEDEAILRSLQRDPSEAGVTRAAQMFGREKRHVAKVFAKQTGHGVAVERARRAPACPRAWRYARQRSWIAG